MTSILFRNLAVLVMSGATFLVPARSQDLNQTDKALGQISRLAHDICNTVALEGSSTSAAVQGKAKAEVSKLIKRLADLGVEGAISFKTTDYDGLLQKDLLTGMALTSGCKERIYGDLRDRLLPAKKPGERITATTGTVSAGGFDFAVERCRIVQNDQIECTFSVTNNGTTRDLRLDSSHCCRVLDYNSNFSYAAAARIANNEVALKRYASGISAPIVGGASSARLLILFAALPTRVDSLAEIQLNVRIDRRPQTLLLKRVAVQNS